MPAPKKALAKSSTADKEAGKQAAFLALRSLLRKYAKEFSVVETTDSYMLNTQQPLYKKKPLMFAYLRKGKAYTSFHLFQIYMFPAEWKISESLRKRMQGKCCLNFHDVDEKLFDELDALLKKGSTKFKTLTAEKVVQVIQSAQR